MYDTMTFKYKKICNIIMIEVINNSSLFSTFPAFLSFILFILSSSQAGDISKYEINFGDYFL